MSDESPEPPPPVRRVNRVVLGCLSVVAFLYFTCLLNVLLPWLAFSVPGVANLAVLTTTTAAALACYLQASTPP
jgi:palmitoyltransferase